MREIVISVLDINNIPISSHIANVVPRVGEYYRLYEDNEYVEGLVYDVTWESKCNKVSHTLSCVITIDFSRTLFKGDL